MLVGATVAVDATEIEVVAEPTAEAVDEAVELETAPEDDPPTVSEPPTIVMDCQSPVSSEYS